MVFGGLLSSCQLGKAFDSSFNSHLYSYPYENNCFTVRDHKSIDSLSVSHGCGLGYAGKVWSDTLTFGIVSNIKPSQDVYREIAVEFLTNTTPNRKCKIYESKYWDEIDHFEYLYSCDLPKFSERIDKFSNYDELCRRWETIDFWDCPGE